MSAEKAKEELKIQISGFDHILEQPTEEEERTDQYKSNYNDYGDPL